MAIPAADLAAARKYGGLVDQLAAGYRNPVTGKALTGQALLLKLAQGESGYNHDAVSSADARSETQFTPGSRQVAISKYGVDPWKNTDSAFHAAALHLLGDINGSKGLEGYNPGSSTYTGYILGQKIGDVGGSKAPAAASTPSPQASSTTTTITPAPAPSLADLLSPQKSVAPSAGIQSPGFSADKYLASTGPAPTGGQMVAQGTDYGALVGALTPQQQGSVSVKTTSSTPHQNAVTQTANALVDEVTHRANQINAQQLPYAWGGGHAQKITSTQKTVPLDCSGAVSAVLGIDPRVASEFEHFGSAGAAPGGKGITIYAKDTHVLMQINGRFFGTSASNPGGGAGWIPRSAIPASYLKGFTARHLAAST